MRRRAASCLLLLLPLTACSGDGGGAEGFPEADLVGACAVLQPDLDTVARIGPELVVGDELAEQTVTDLELAQSNLAAASADLPLAVSAAVDRLTTRLGLVRLASEAGRLEAAREAQVQEGYEEVLRVCTEEPAPS